MSVWCDIPASIGPYELGRSIGKGSFSLVKHAVDNRTSDGYAVKIVSKASLNSPESMERFEREVKSVIKMDHPGIVKMYDFLVDLNYFYLVMEYIPGGTLLSQVSNEENLNEEPAKPIMKQLVDILVYIHSKNVCHRDIKLDNIMFESRGRIKLIDFGFSRFGDPGQLFITPIGTPAYAAPEVYSTCEYDGKAADMWSLGVVIYSYITGSFPWKGSNRMNVMNQITSGSFTMVDGMSESLQDLLKRLMDVNPARRLTALEAATHPWFLGVDVGPCSSRSRVRKTLSINTFSRMFSSCENFKVDSPRTQLEKMKKSISQADNARQCNPQNRAPLAAKRINLTPQSQFDLSCFRKSDTNRISLASKVPRSSLLLRKVEE